MCADEYFDQGDCAHIIIVTDTHIEIQPYPRAVVLQLPALKRDCDKCAVGWKAEETAEFYLNYDASYFSDYSLYYTGGGQPKTIESCTNLLLYFCLSMAAFGLLHTIK